LRGSLASAAATFIIELVSALLYDRHQQCHVKGANVLSKTMTDAKIVMERERNDYSINCVRIVESC
jgi:hypothetical protein